MSIYFSLAPAVGIAVTYDTHNKEVGIIIPFLFISITFPYGKD